jgi:hypothetical protein
MHASDALCADAALDVILRLADTTEQWLAVGIQGSEGLAVACGDGVGEMSL